MLNNNKGFTVIELIMSFVFTSLLAISLFSIIVQYRSKQTDSTIISDLLAFKSHLIMDIQEDIQIKGLKEIATCPPSDEERNRGELIHPRCVIMSFNDDTSKTFEIGSDHKYDVIENENGTESEFHYTTPYIIYGDIRYSIPDAANVYVDDDYILQKSSAFDGLETGTNLYKINFNLKHTDLDTNIAVVIVASGTLPISSGSGTFKQFNIGQEVYIQLNATQQKKFRVIQNSSRYTKYLTLLYDDEYDSSLVYNSTDYNVLGNISNRYDGSLIKTKVYAIQTQWTNADEVRLITTEEIARIASFCPQYRGVDSPDVSLSTAPSWLTNKSYWTMSPKILSTNDNGKKVWVIKSSNKTLTSAKVNQSYALRPVIVVQKDYVLN